MTNATPKKQNMIGVVVSDVSDKTVVVKVDSQKRHPKYKKSYKISKRYKAHDENNEYHVGDRVVIEATRPISKEKKFKVVGKA